jgi:hypothetical protein
VLEAAVAVGIKMGRAARKRIGAILMLGDGFIQAAGWYFK